MLDALKIQPGQTVADVGAGRGLTPALRLWPSRVGPSGSVLATDVPARDAPPCSTDNAKSVGVRPTSRPILCDTRPTPNCPKRKVDLALMVDVYHECVRPRSPP